VFYWACETLAPGIGAAWPTAYGTAEPDRAYAGYTDPIMLQCWTEADWIVAQGLGFSDPYAAGMAFSADVSDNVEITLNSLATGSTVHSAKVTAHNQVPMVRLGGTAFFRIAADVVGDWETRIKYVYFSRAERAAMQATNRSIDLFLIKLPIQ
jgi:hypothetical protein